MTKLGLIIKAVLLSLVWIVGVYVVLILITKWCWGYVVPQVFPKAVAEGYIAGEIGFWTAAVMYIGPVGFLGYKSINVS